jgi:hypothetical protein
MGEPIINTSVFHCLTSNKIRADVTDIDEQPKGATKREGK